MWFMKLTENTSFPEAEKQWQVPFGKDFGWKSQAMARSARGPQTFIAVT